MATLTLEQMQAEIDRLTNLNAALSSKNARSLTIKVSEKGAVSVYGLMRFPVTLYANTWLKLLAVADDIKRFIEVNKAYLKFEK